MNFNNETKNLGVNYYVDTFDLLNFNFQMIVIRFLLLFVFFRLIKTHD